MIVTTAMNRRVEIDDAEIARRVANQLAKGPSIGPPGIDFGEMPAGLTLREDIKRRVRIRAAMEKKERDAAMNRIKPPTP